MLGTPDSRPLYTSPNAPCPKALQDKQNCYKILLLYFYLYQLLIEL